MSTHIQIIKDVVKRDEIQTKLFSLSPCVVKIFVIDVSYILQITATVLLHSILLYLIIYSILFAEPTALGVLENQ